MSNSIESPPTGPADVVIASYIDRIDSPFLELVRTLTSSVKQVNLHSYINMATTDGREPFFRIGAHALNWRCKFKATATDRLIIYSFEFPNTCDPALFHSFSVVNHHHFRAVERSDFDATYWYQYMGPTSLGADIVTFFGLDRLFLNDTQPQSRIYFHQHDEKLVMEFEFLQNQKLISISFRKAVPC